jgi:hypothetical protein
MKNETWKERLWSDCYCRLVKCKDRLKVMGVSVAVCSRRDCLRRKDFKKVKKEAGNEFRA